MQTPQTDRLAQRLADRAADGLVDVRFCLANRREASSDLVCAEANALYAALDAGNYAPLDFADSRQ